MADPHGRTLILPLDPARLDAMGVARAMVESIELTDAVETGGHVPTVSLASRGGHCNRTLDFLRPVSGRSATP